MSMHAFREGHLGQVIERFYEAAACPDLWRSALHDLAMASGAEGAVLMPAPNSPLVPICSVGLDEMVEIGSKEGWFVDNPRLDRGIPALKHHLDIATESQVFTQKELDKHPFNAEYINRKGFRWFVGALMVPDGRSSVSFSIERSARRGMFSHREVALLGRTIPHLQRAGNLAVKLANSKAEGHIEIIDAMNYGAALLDAAGLVVRTNAQFESVLGNSIDVVHRRLTAKNKATDTALGCLISSVVTRQPIYEASAIKSVAVSQPSAAPLVIHAAPLVASACDLFQKARAILIVTHAGSNRKISRALLMQAFDLSTAEADIAIALFSGKSVEEIRQQRGVSIYTLRTQLSHIYSKTATDSQQKLILLLSQMSINH